MKQPEDNKTVDIEDIFVWPNGTSCYRYESDMFIHMSDDYVVYYFGSPEWREFVYKEE